MYTNNIRKSAIVNARVKRYEDHKKEFGQEPNPGVVRTLCSPLNKKRIEPSDRWVTPTGNKNAPEKKSIFSRPWGVTLIGDKNTPQTKSTFFTEKKEEQTIPIKTFLTEPDFD